MKYVTYAPSLTSRIFGTSKTRTFALDSKNPNASKDIQFTADSTYSIMPRSRIRRSESTYEDEIRTLSRSRSRSSSQGWAHHVEKHPRSPSRAIQLWMGGRQEVEGANTQSGQPIPAVRQAGGGGSKHPVRASPSQL